MLNSNQRTEAPSFSGLLTFLTYPTLLVVLIVVIVLSSWNLKRNFDTGFYETEQARKKFGAMWEGIKTYNPKSLQF